MVNKDFQLVTKCGMNDLRNLSVRTGRSSIVFALCNLSNQIKSNQIYLTTQIKGK